MTFCALILTDENVLVHAEYKNPITHLEVFSQFKKLGIIVKDSIIKPKDTIHLTQILTKLTSGWVFKNFHEDVNIDTIRIKEHKKGTQVIILGVSGMTTSGQEFYASCTDLVCTKNNFF